MSHSIPNSVEVAPESWRRWVAFDHCRVLLPHFSFAGRRDPLSRLHQLSLDDERVTHAEPSFLARLYVRTVFSAVALQQMWIFFLRYGGYVKKHDGISRRQQLRDLWHCIWNDNRYARHYYWRKLYQLPRREMWLENLEHRQLTTLLRHLNRRLPTSRITNKFNFHQHCRRHGLATPEVIAAWDPIGHLLVNPPAPRTGDLFLKPADDFGSTGILVLHWDELTRTHRFGDRTLHWPALLVALGRHAFTTGRAFILQPRLRNAPRNAVYGNFDLCNLRIVTARLPDGEPEVIGAFIRLPSQFTTGGYNRHILFTSVDIADGRMGTGRLREITRGEFPRHPETDAPIQGRVIPGWSEMTELALQGHRSMPWMPFVGWDLIDTEQGPMLLEANAFWGGDALQPPGALPLGRTRFPEIYLAWFEKLYGPKPAPVPALLPLV